MRLLEVVAEERLWIGTEPGFDRERYRSDWRRTIAGDWGAVFVAVDGDAIAGYAAVRPHQEYGHVIGMLVQPAHRGKGLGRKLLQHVVAWAADAHLRDVSLLVFAHNEAAIALYESEGFVRTEYYPNDVMRQDGRVFDTILMRRVLS